MPNYLRWRREGGTFFFTIVTHQRRPIFRQQRWRVLLREAIGTVRRRRPFVQQAVVLLPDHLHVL